MSVIILREGENDGVRWTLHQNSGIHRVYAGDNLYYKGRSRTVAQKKVNLLVAERNAEEAEKLAARLPKIHRGE